MTNQQLNVDPEALRGFATSYKAGTGQLANLARLAQEVITTFESEASQYTMKGRAMPIANETQRILREQLLKFTTFVNDVAKSAESDSDYLTKLADKYESSDQQASQNIANR